MTKAPELNTNQMITIAYLIGLIVVIFVVYKILKGLGLIKDAQKDTAVEDLRTTDYLNPDYFKGKQGDFRSLGADAAILHASELRAAMQGFGTDEEAIYAVFGKLYNKVNCSELAATYLQGFGDDLQTDLLNELTDSEKQTLWDIIKKLPNK
jgi:hypothetical protein